MEFSEVRAKYPQYDDMSDGDLATALHGKFYSDLPFDAFAQRIGYQATPKPAPIPPAPSAQSYVNSLPPFMRALTGVGETALAAGTGMAGSVVGGLAGLADAGLSAAGLGSNRPGDTVRSVQSALTYLPRTEQGQAVSKAAALPMEYYGKGVHWAGEQVRGNDSGGVRDFLGTTLEVAGEAAPAALGGTQALKAAGSVKALPLNRQQTILKPAHELGMVVAPSEMGVSSSLQGAGGKVRTAQLASDTNTQIATKTAHEQLGIPTDTPLIPKTLDGYRATQYQNGYVPLKSHAKAIIQDDIYLGEVAALPARSVEILKSFPDADVAGAAQIAKLADSLFVPEMKAGAAVERIRGLRFEADKNLGAAGDPAKVALGQAQRAAANSLEGLLERNLQASGDMALLEKFREARKNIATAHTVQGAVNPSLGTVNPHRLGASAAPLEGKLKTVADFGTAFPKSSQVLEQFGGVVPISPLDVAMGVGTGAVGGALTGSPFGMGAFMLPMGRPLLSQLPLRQSAQRGLLEPRKTPMEKAGLLYSVPLFDQQAQ